MGETRVDLLHLLEDLRDAYPGGTEEAILTEIVANSLDSGASTIAVATDAAAATITIVDDGAVLFESREGDPELGRLVESTVWVNEAHPHTGARRRRARRAITWPLPPSWPWRPLQWSPRRSTLSCRRSWRAGAVR